MKNLSTTPKIGEAERHLQEARERNERSKQRQQIQTETPPAPKPTPVRQISTNSRNNLYGNSDHPLYGNSGNNRNTPNQGRGGNQNLQGNQNTEVHQPVSGNDQGSGEPIQEENKGEDIMAQLREMEIKIQDVEEQYSNVSSSNRLKKMNLRKQLNRMRVEFNKLKKQLP